jgi:hypothetical protein
MYGDPPVSLGVRPAECSEFMFYQYLPIKLAGVVGIQGSAEPRLQCFDSLIGAACCDYVGFRGLDEFVRSYIYVTAKYGWNRPTALQNRPGWHSDGFMTDDINYIWSDRTPTEFNTSAFRLTMDDDVSMEEMRAQAEHRNNLVHAPMTLLRLDQYCIHRPAEPMNVELRTFLKVSFSRDKYDLAGNSHNYLLDYTWPMRERSLARNIPQHPTVTGEL